MSNEEAGFFGS